MPPSRNSRKRVNEVPTFSAPSTHKINLEEYEEVEDEYGFRYMRKKQRLNAPSSIVTKNVTSNVESTPVSSITLTARLSGPSQYAATPSTPTPSKQVLENNRRKRRSSFAVMAAQNQAARASSIGVSLNKILPPENVKTAEFHKHLQPEMPGPVKMRQLLIWAVQKASNQLARASPLNALADLSEDLIEALLRNEINCSWYQRPSISAADSSSITFYTPNPQNQELSECIDLYTNYQQKLAEECKTWESLQVDDCEIKENVENINNSVEIDNSLNALFAAECAQMSQWLHGLPLSIDRLDWHTKLAISFGDHSKQFCESVFHQIFAKFFAGDLQPKKQRAEPMLVLRALSAKNE